VVGAAQQATQNARYVVIPRTLVFLLHGSDVLLLKGAPNKRLWAHRYNGVGGHVEAGETVLAAALREVQEEAGISELAWLELRAVIHITTSEPQIGIMLYVFVGESRTRVAHESNEGSLEWWDRQALPHSEMVEDLPELLAHVLNMNRGSSPLFGLYWYNPDGTLHTSFSS